MELIPPPPGPGVDVAIGVVEAEGVLSAASAVLVDAGVIVGVPTRSLSVVTFGPIVAVGMI